MLPSTGYFKGINCPFYDNGLCERPYCHFRHVKKESQSTARDGIESGAILQKLVSAAVQKVLQQTEVSGAAALPIDTSVDNNKVNVAVATHKATYNPTPISELNKINNTDTENNEDINEQRKRHIPVPYTPRKPASLPIKRPAETNGSSKPFIYIPPTIKYTPGSVDNVQNDKYTPTGGIESNEKYLPGTEKEIQQYTPDESVQHSSSKCNYVPSDKNISKNKILEYKPIKVSKKSETPSVTYQPTPRSLAPCFSSDEEEPDSKKRKLSSDFNGLDDLGPEFDILDQILDEEKQTQDAKNKLKKDMYKPTNSKYSKENNQSTGDFTIKKNVKDNKLILINDSKIVKSLNENNESGRDDTKVENKDKCSKSQHKNKSNKKEKSTSEDKERVEKKTKHVDKKSRHKSSSKEKDKSRKDKKSSEKKEHRSKIPDQSSKHSKHTSSKKPDTHSSKNKCKDKDKNKHKKSHRSSRNKDKDEHKSNEKESLNELSDNDHHNPETDGIDEELYEISESDEDTIALQCKKIFEEYVPTKKVKCIEETTRIEDINDDEYVPAKKRISRTIDKNIKVIPKTPMKPDYKVSAAQTMAERLAKVREYHKSKNVSTASINENTSIKLDLSKNTFNTSNIGNSKIRIAHVPYASTLMNAKKNIPPSKNVMKNEPSTSTTAIQTVKKGAHRVAHMPNEKFIDRPGVLEPLASKIAANVRSTYLNMMIDECLKIYLSATDAYARAQHEELTTSKKCSTVQIYKNSAVLTVSRLRKELQECNGIKKSGLDCPTLQKNSENVCGKTSNAGSWSIENKNRNFLDNSKEFTGAKFYKNIQKWILTEEQLQENGFPRPHSSGVKGRATIHGQNKQKPPKGFIRTCCRCKKEYTVDKKGFPAFKEECIYHPNNKYRVRGEARYQCCSQDATSDGCCIAPTHVYEYIDFENLKGYVRTLPPENVMDDYGVYSLDCEMCYTTHGLDLTRVTVINSSCKVIYETLIKPLHPIMDYNTRYSGITEEQMLTVKTTLLDVQATLLAMFNSKTILVGHSLESDFKALKLIHDTVIDTSVLFPHKMGHPYKRALRNLSSEHLKKIIQNSVDGHDSAEDATVCMELLCYKLKEDLKTR